ncbi:protein NDRG2 isoform X2 [Hemicordylus capensis]|uniref:protein NDRG2 isoform X2 n=1 Tax=Hemicordylus capensis TaxID=884348 RepID=UPI002303944A|nr:protein NDRG2 isoform X2 [Hemicordylus capensis]XP_053116290.1 protein NDRG2 isoform X2 [Hemicordylus capensis]
MTELQEVQITEEKPLLKAPGGPDPGKDAELIAAKLLQEHGQKHTVETPYGVVTITIHGTPKPKRPAILTYHDVGQNHHSCFDTLFHFEDMQEIIKNFVVIHVDAPGMEEGAPAFPLGYQYPSLDQLADMIPCILQYVNFTSIIGIGVGAGAYVLARYSLSHADTVEGLVLINIDPNAKGWMDWAAHKLTGLTSSNSDMILHHLFSQEELSKNNELVQQQRDILGHATNLPNIHLYWSSYNSRRDLSLERGGDICFKCPVMLVVGDQAPHEDAVVECNSKLDPTQTSFLKMADSGGQPQLTQPGKLTEAFKYFVQGMGYIPHVLDKKLSLGSGTFCGSPSPPPTIPWHVPANLFFHPHPPSPWLSHSCVLSNAHIAYTQPRLPLGHGAVCSVDEKAEVALCGFLLRVPTSRRLVACCCILSSRGCQLFSVLHCGNPICFPKQNYSHY